MLRRTADGLFAYVPQKDLEQPIVSTEHPGLWGGWVRLGNGWVLDLPAMPEGTALPLTVNARVRAREE